MGGSCGDGGRVGRPVSGCKARWARRLCWRLIDRELVSAHDIGFFGLVVEASTQR